MNPPQLDLTHTVLVLIDLQKGIVGRPQLAPRPGAEVVANAAKLAARFRAAGAPVVLVNVTPSPDGRDALKPECDRSMMPRGAFPPDFAELVPELDAQPGDLRITKRQWGAFYGTELDLQLRRRGIRTIVLAGIATNIGVESTARDAFERGYNQVLVEDAMASMAAEMHAFAVQSIFPMIGLVRSTEEVLAGCGAAE
jgi:nicotinamidase-related amidase